jgi:hypothetical protein
MRLDTAPCVHGHRDTRRALGAAVDRLFTSIGVNPRAQASEAVEIAECWGSDDWCSIARRYGVEPVTELDCDAVVDGLLARASRTPSIWRIKELSLDDLRDLEATLCDDIAHCPSEQREAAWLEGLEYSLATVRDELAARRRRVS